MRFRLLLMCCIVTLGLSQSGSQTNGTQRLFMRGIDCKPDTVNMCDSVVQVKLDSIRAVLMIMIEKLKEEKKQQLKPNNYERVNETSREGQR